MERDLRLTGKFRDQTDHVKAPVGFEVNNPWKVSSSPFTFWLEVGIRYANEHLVGKKVHLVLD